MHYIHIPINKLINNINNCNSIREIKNKKIVQKETPETRDCNCRVKSDYPLNADCGKESVIYKCTATTCDSKNVYLGLTERKFKNQKFMIMSNLFETNFVPIALVFRFMYGKKK